MPWDINEAKELIRETLEVVRLAGSEVRRLVIGATERAAEMDVEVAKLQEIIEGLSSDEISTLRSTPWITRGDAKELISICKRLRSMADMTNLVKLCLDMTSQSRSFFDLMVKVSDEFGLEKKEAESGLEDKLTEEQLIQVMEMIHQNELERANPAADVSP